MKKSAFVAVMALSFLTVEVFGGDDVATLIRRDGSIEYIPDSHIMFAVPRQYNTHTFDIDSNPKGMKNGRWPLLDLVCRLQESGNSDEVDRSLDELGFGGSSAPQQPGVRAPGLGFGGSASPTVPGREDPCVYERSRR